MLRAPFSVLRLAVFRCNLLLSFVLQACFPHYIAFVPTQSGTPRAVAFFTGPKPDRNQKDRDSLCAFCCSLQAPELSRMLALLVAVSWMPAAVFETAAENEILATVTGAGGGTAALVASAPRVEVSPCTGKSARLPTPQCAAWQAFHDSTMGRRWRVCADARNDPCACAGYDGASPTCNTAGTAITQMCVLPCCICVQGRHSPTPPFLQLIPALVTTPLYITPASCGTVASRAHCPLS